MQHKPFHIKIHVKYYLALLCFYSQTLPNIENTVQKDIEKMVKVPKSSNPINIRSNAMCSYVSRRPGSLNTRCYIVSVKLFLTLARNAYL